MPRDFSAMGQEELVLQALKYVNEGYFNQQCYDEICKRLKALREKKRDEASIYHDCTFYPLCPRDHKCRGCEENQLEQ